MDLRCPKCNSSDLKKVSLAYQEGLYRTDTGTRLSGALIGGSGPDLVVGRATTQALDLSWHFSASGGWFFTSTPRRRIPQLCRHFH
jgi:hypothetical protein